MSITRAVHLKNWANLTEARGMLPDLVRRLVRARVSNDAKVNIPAYEQTHRPGEDGHVIASISDEFIPNGTSFWEMGVNSDHRSKAISDYANRTASTPKEIRKKSTFVFVTPREWQAKDEWAAEKRREGKWKDVIVIDCNDLEHWINRCVSVDLWFAQQTGQPCDGFIDLHRRWQDIQKVGAQPIIPAVVLNGREALKSEVQAFLQRPPSATMLQCSSVGDGIDFLAALTFHIDDKDLLANRMVVICDRSNWQRVSVNLTPICLVVPSWIRLPSEDIQRAINSAHHVIMVGQRSSTTRGSKIILPRRNVYDLEDQLIKCGFPVSKARSAAIGSAGSTAVLKRLISTSPASDLPAWAEDQQADQLAVFALIGGWNTADCEAEDPFPFFANRPADSMILEDFMDWTHDELVRQVSRWSQCDDPLFITYGDVALVASRESAWHLLGRAVTAPMLTKFVELAAFVLGDEDPAFDLQADQRWAAAIHGKTHDCSNELRNGVIETLVLMNSVPIFDPHGGRRDFSGAVRKVFTRLFPDGMTWQRWGTLNRQLPLIAEADPEFLLGTIEKDLQSQSPQTPILFEHCGVGVFEREYHCGLLWALEVMAWNPKYLLRVSAILIELCNFESSLPQNYGNRPSATFSGIFQHWYPGTAASADQRLAVLDQLIQDLPSATWDRLVDLIDDVDSASDSTQEPVWRTWADGYSQTLVDAERKSFITGIAERTIDTAGDSHLRWAAVFRQCLLRISDDVAEKTIARLRKFADEPSQSYDKSELWSEIDDFVRHQEELDENSDYRMSDQRLSTLQTVRDDMVPDDPVYTNDWLFNDPSKLPGFERADEFQEYERELDRLQRNALKEIHHQRGTEGVVRHLARRHRGHSSGWCCGVESLLSIDEVTEMLSGDDIKQLDFASGYIGGRFSQCGVQCLDEFGVTDRSLEVAVKVLTAITSHRAIWDWIEQNADGALADAYWAEANPFCKTESVSDVEYCVDKMLKVGRPFSACKMLQLQLDKHNPGVDLIARCLEVGYAGGHGESSSDVDAYVFQKLVGYLQEQNADPSRLVLMEWGYLPILTMSTSRVKPRVLQQASQQNPEFFTTLITHHPRRDWTSLKISKNTIERSFFVNAHVSCYPICRRCLGKLTLRSTQ